MAEKNDIGRYIKKVSDQQKQIKELKEEAELARAGMKELTVALDIVINSFVNAFGTAKDDDSTVLEVEAASYKETMDYTFDSTLTNSKYTIVRRKKKNEKDDMGISDYN